MGDSRESLIVRPIYDGFTTLDAWRCAATGSDAPIENLDRAG